MELTGFIAKVNLPSLGLKPVRYEDGSLVIEGIPDRKYALLLLDCLEGLAAARDKIVTEKKGGSHDRDDHVEHTPPLALEAPQAGNSGSDESAGQPATEAETAQAGNRLNDHMNHTAEKPQASNSEQDMPTSAAEAPVNIVPKQQPGLDPQAALDAYDAIEAGNSKSELIDNPVRGGLPEGVSTATTLRPIITYLRNEEGLKGTDEIIDRCEQLKEVVPYLHRTKNLSQRVPRTLAAIEAE